MYSLPEVSCHWLSICNFVMAMVMARYIYVCTKYDHSLIVMETYISTNLYMASFLSYRC